MWVETISKEPQDKLISMQLPQMSIVSIQLAMGSVGFLTCLILAATENHGGTDNSEGLESQKKSGTDFFSDSKPVAYCEYFCEASDWIKDK